MSSDLLQNIILCIIIFILIMANIIYSFISEKKKTVFYNKIINYETNWDKYRTMVKIQKRILFKKRLELLKYKILVRLKWN